MIIIFAGKGMYILMGLGIAFVVAGFYGMPISWSIFGEAKTLYRVVYSIEAENIRKPEDIAMHLNKSEKQVRAYISKVINKMYLKDFRWNGKEIAKEHKKIEKFKCPNCGASLDKSKGYLKCEYCNTDLREIDNG